MSRNRWISFAALALLVALSSCAKKTETASEITSDSLLASSPVEQPAGDLTPATDYTQPAEPAPVTPAPRRTPPRSTPPHSTSPSHQPSTPPAPSESPSVTMGAGT